MARNTIQLGHDHADVLRARRRRDTEQFLYGFTIAEAVGHRRDVIHPIESGNELAVRLRFAKLLHTAMQIPDHTLRVDDTFAIQLEFHLKHSMCGRVLGTHADGYFTRIK